MQLDKMRDEFTETVARLILFKDRQMAGASQPGTDDWADLYLARQMPSVESRGDILDYNKFTAEVDGTVSLLIRSVFLASEH